MSRQINLYPLAKFGGKPWSADARTLVRRGNRLGIPPAEFRGSPSPFQKLKHSGSGLSLLSPLARQAFLEAFGTETPQIMDLKRHIEGNSRWREGLSAFCVNGSRLKLIRELEEFFVANGISVEKTLHTLGLSQRLCSITHLLLELRGILSPFPTIGQLRDALYRPMGWRGMFACHSLYKKGDLEEFERFAVKVGALERKDARACALGMNSHALSAVAELLGKDPKLVTVQEVFDAVSGKDLALAMALDLSDQEARKAAARFAWGMDG
jgi:hypothetical protein